MFPILRKRAAAAVEHPELKGMRCQILAALQHIHYGHPVIMEWKINNFEEHFKNPHKRNEFFKKIHQRKAWEEKNENILPAMVPGTWFPSPIGKVLLKNKWIRPLENPRHWIPNLCMYGITEEGEEALSRGMRWWHSQPLHKKLLLRFTE